MTRRVGQNRRSARSLLAAIIACIPLHATAGRWPVRDSPQRLWRAFNFKIDTVLRLRLIVVSSLARSTKLEHSTDFNEWIAVSLHDGLTTQLRAHDMEFSVAVWEAEPPKIYGDLFEGIGGVPYETCVALPASSSAMARPCREGGATIATYEPPLLTTKHVMVFYDPAEAFAGSSSSARAAAAPVPAAEDNEMVSRYFFALNWCLQRERTPPIDLTRLASCFSETFQPLSRFSGLRGVAVIPEISKVEVTAGIGIWSPNGRLIVESVKLLHGEGGVDLQSPLIEGPQNDLWIVVGAPIVIP